MSNLIVWSNNASSLLASGITSSSATATVTAGEGTLFPSISAGQYAVATLEDTSGNIEIVYVTARTTDTMTIARAQEGTTAQSFASGSRFELRVTAGVLATLLQKTGADTLSGETEVTGVLALGSGGSIQGGEIAGTAVRGAAGVTGNQILVPSNGTDSATMGGSALLTTNNIVGHMPSGAGVVLTGMVLFWTGASNEIPTGYVLCDGTEGTPDLRDQFIVGGGGALPTSGGSFTGDTASATTGVISAPVALTVDQLPAHHHTFFSGLAASGNSVGKCPDWAVGATANVNIPTGSPYAGTQIIGDTGAGGTHVHALTDAGHVHGVALPPYRAIFAIMKT